MKMRIIASEVNGKTRAPASKSHMHRAIICAALASGTSNLSNPLICDDTEATMRACEMLGASISRGKELIVESEGSDGLKAPAIPIDCKGSGTTLRLMSAVAALAPGKTVLTGNASLKKRPVGELLDALIQLGVNAVSENGDGLPPVIVHGGGIRGGNARLRGDISSQFISGLALACCKAREETIIEVTTELESKPYLEMTLEVMREFGASIGVSGDLRRIAIPPMQTLKPRNCAVEGDFSSAAFILAAGALAGKVCVSGLNPSSKQGDRKIVQILMEMGARVMETANSVTVEKAELNGIEIDASQTPDLVPICAVLGTQARGETRIANAARLRLKESDRLASTASELRKMGAEITELEDGLVIHGPTKLSGAIINPHNDHRIAMACSVAGLVASGETVVENAECINKSYPSFADDLKRLGGVLK